VDQGLPIDTTARARSRIALFTAGLVAAFALFEAIRGVPELRVVLAARAVWIAALLAAARLVLAARGPWTRVLTLAAVVVSVAALFVLSLVQGDRFGSIAFLFAAPLFVGVLLPDARSAVWIAAVLSTAGVGASFLLRGAPPAEALMCALRAASAGAVAVFGAAVLERVRRHEVRLAEERARVADALARSEQRRAEVEPLAAAGSSAARVAHDMSNPLASIRVNLDWLHEAVQERRLAAEDAEIAEVLRETRECVERLGANLRDFRAAARSARGQPMSDEGAGPPPRDHTGAAPKP
jgi:signal transduction histidine kinase